ncbi:HlyD family efflux transporter periplasmic adaptor subunit [Chitiniphilus purpureus]|uniref:HlyD family efflux transporter periplasmic adaptor subunit n=1 Tax=Chitiniphilus purpureus TaxID=2981137 RepID=A0ABY6DLT4_9NEIS|nr:HlyD family efflux transporter periplasmic adaptor subunit [Chitiniphilus sp. CD1]UXY15314.1 HlyD family efflux transporter periplasmic adaptor subunit [Chitiniphilus sp. CD1]
MMRCLLLLPLLLAACTEHTPPGYPGYVEGEYVAIAAPQAGRLTHLAVRRGQQVAAKAALFTLENDQADAVRRQHQQQLAAAQAQLQDMQSGKRPQEIEVLQARQVAAEAEARRAAQQRERDAIRLRAGAIAQAQFDQSHATAIAAAAEVRRLQRELTVARLPGRSAQLRAQAAQVEAARAALSQADWVLRQTAQRAPAAALVSDTLYREGEWVPAGSPVVRLLPPANVKVRFFVPQAALAQLAPGRALAVRCDGCGVPVAAWVDYVSPQAEYTPPVIYSNDARHKLVFLVEARLPPQTARLRPGQPVTVGLR